MSIHYAAKVDVPDCSNLFLYVGKSFATALIRIHSYVKENHIVAGKIEESVYADVIISNSTRNGVETSTLNVLYDGTPEVFMYKEEYGHLPSIVCSVEGVNWVLDFDAPATTSVEPSCYILQVEDIDSVLYGDSYVVCVHSEFKRVLETAIEVLKKGTFPTLQHMWIDRWVDDYVKYSIKLVTDMKPEQFFVPADEVKALSGLDLEMTTLASLKVNHGDKATKGGC